ncbi:MAG: hypothetical protein SNJ78_08165 [Spirochaetales bacterium]
MDIELFYRKYQFPVLTDARFHSLQQEISTLRKEYEEGTRERKTFFGLKKIPPRYGPEERLQIMETLVSHYDSLIQLLKEKICSCREAFQKVGEGVQGLFQEKIHQLERLEEKRKALLERLEAGGKQDVARAIEQQQEKVRILAQNLGKACILIIRKLRHALNALETLADDETAQRDVLRSLREDVDLYRSVLEFNRDLNALQKDISALTRTALNFDDFLSKSLGPLTILIEEISKTDKRVAESLEEVRRISLELEKEHLIIEDVTLGDRVLDYFVSAHFRQEMLDSFIQSLTSPNMDFETVEFDVRLVEGLPGKTFDFEAFSRNLSALVERGLSDLYQPLSPVTNAPAVSGEVAFGAATVGIETPASSIYASSTPSPSTSTPSTPFQKEASEVVGSKVRAEEEADTSIAQNQEPEPGPLPQQKVKPVEKELYRMPVSRAHPALVVFLLDMSGSMDDAFQGKYSKAEFVAFSVDRTLEELVVRCRKADGVRDYFHIACLGFGDNEVWSLLPMKEVIVPISQLAQSPRSIQQDSEGLPHPCWVKPGPNGNTPMCKALAEACLLVGPWCDQHFSSYPPTVILLTDGESTDGTPVKEAQILKQLHTQDGNTLLFCVHIQKNSTREILFPNQIPDIGEAGRILYELSSPMPPHVLRHAQQYGYSLQEGSRFFAYGVGAERIAHFFDLGTRPVQFL